MVYDGRRRYRVPHVQLVRDFYFIDCLVTETYYLLAVVMGDSSRNSTYNILQFNI